MDHNSFILYNHSEELIEMLSDEDCGKLMRALFVYSRTKEPPTLPPTAKIVFTAMRQYMDENDKKWDETLEKRRQAGKRGAQNRWAAERADDDGDGAQDDGEDPFVGEDIPTPTDAPLDDIPTDPTDALCDDVPTAENHCSAKENDCSAAEDAPNAQEPADHGDASHSMTEHGSAIRAMANDGNAIFPMAKMAVSESDSVFESVSVSESDFVSVSESVSDSESVSVSVSESEPVSDSDSDSDFVSVSASVPVPDSVPDFASEFDPVSGEVPDPVDAPDETPDVSPEDGLGYTDNPHVLRIRAQMAAWREKYKNLYQTETTTDEDTVDEDMTDKDTADEDITDEDPADMTADEDMDTEHSSDRTDERVKLEPDFFDTDRERMNRATLAECYCEAKQRDYPRTAEPKDDDFPFLRLGQTPSTGSTVTPYAIPTLEAVVNYCRSAGLNTDPERFYRANEAKGWMVGGRPIRDWRAALRAWSKNEWNPRRNAGGR